jgi:hypothetical protein
MNMLSCSSSVTPNRIDREEYVSFPEGHAFNKSERSVQRPGRVMAHKPECHDGDHSQAFR